MACGQNSGENFLERLMDSTRVMIYIKDRYGRYVLVNQYFEAFFGMSQARIIGKTDQQIFPEEIAALLSEKDKQVALVETETDGQNFFEEPGEQTSDIAPQQQAFAEAWEEYLPAVPEKNDAGITPVRPFLVSRLKWTGSDVNDAPYIGFVGVDITAQKRRAQKLKSELNMLHTALEALTHPFYLIDAKTYEILQGNSASGFKKGKNIKCYQLTHYRETPCQGADHPCPVDIIKQTGKPTQVEHTHYDEKGDPRDVEISAYPVKDERGNVTHIIEMCQDVTERKQAERAQARFRLAMDSSADSIYIIDHPSYQIVDVNATACRKLGYAREELIGMRPFDIKPYITEEEMKEKFEQVLSCTTTNHKGLQAETVGDECVEIFETYHRAKNGQEYPVEVSIRLANMPKEMLFVASVRDLTRHKQDEAKLAEHALELELKNMEVEDLYQKLEAEVRKAKQIHERTLPRTFPLVEGVSMAAHYQAAEELGGDFYNAILQEEQLLFYVSDVTGHGMDGAIVSAFIKEVIDSYVSMTSGKLQPGKVLQYLAQRYRQENYPDEYCVSIFLGVLDLNRGALCYSGAGYHVEPLLGNGSDRHLKITSEGLPICNTVPFHMMDFSEQTLAMQKADTLLLYTDGLYEQKVGEMPYGDRISEVFFNHCHLPPEVIIHALNEDFAVFNQDSFQGDDDITVLALQLDPEDIKCFTWELESSPQGLEMVNTELYPTIAPYLNETTAFQSLYELVANAMEHGNHFEPSQTVQVTLNISKRYLMAVIEDQGDGFDWLARKRAFNNIHDHCGERGRGLIMSKQLSQGLLYNQKGNKAFLLLEEY